MLKTIKYYLLHSIKNSCVEASSFIKWLNSIYFKSYSFKPNEGIILYYDKAKSQLTKEVINLFAKYNCFID